MKFLVTGGCGFLGSNLSQHVLSLGEELHIIDNFFRHGSRENQQYLKTQGSFAFYENDVKDAEQIDKIVKDVQPDVVFHLAGQVAMTTSIANPRLDFETNVVGGVNVLEAVRKHAPNAAVFYSSTNKVYGDLEELEYQETATRYQATKYPNGFDETLRLDFRSPYGCSKGAVDQYMLDYARIFGVKTVVFRHSSIFGGRQFPTFDQGWIGWFITKALETRRKKGSDASFTISGSGKQVRDVLFASDIVKCYFSALSNIGKSAGNAYNIGGGMNNSLSLLELFSILETELDVKLAYEKLPPRQSDQKVFVANNAKAKTVFGWAPEVDKLAGVRGMTEWLSENDK